MQNFCFKNLLRVNEKSPLIQGKMQILSVF